MFYFPLLDKIKDALYLFIPHLKYKPNDALESRKTILALLFTTSGLASLALAIVAMYLATRYEIPETFAMVCGLFLILVSVRWAKHDKKTPEFYNRWWLGKERWWK